METIIHKTEPSKTTDKNSEHHENKEKNESLEIVKHEGKLQRQNTKE